MSGAGRDHILISLVLLALCGVLCAAVDVAARSQAVANRLDDRSQAQYAAHNRAYLRTRNYGDFFETLMLDELPKADYSHGGAYVMGSSNVVFCAEFGDLPANERRLIHNYGFPGANPTEMLQFVRYLTDHEGWLRAGGDKTAVLICLNYTDLEETTPQFTGAGGYFAAYLNGSGLFQYDAQRGISEAPMSALERRLLLRRNQWRSFVHRLQRAMERVPRRQADAVALRKAAEQASAAGESVENSGQWAELGRLLDYLRERGVRATLLMMPTGSWYMGLPPEQQFQAKLPSLAEAKGVRLIDISGLLRDDEFMDHHHATYDGAKKVHEILRKWAVEQLQKTGALPEGRVP